MYLEHILGRVRNVGLRIGLLRVGGNRFSWRVAGFRGQCVGLAFGHIVRDVYYQEKQKAAGIGHIRQLATRVPCPTLRARHDVYLFRFSKFSNLLCKNLRGRDDHGETTDAVMPNSMLLYCTSCRMIWAPSHCIKRRASYVGKSRATGRKHGRRHQQTVSRKLFHLSKVLRADDKVNCMTTAYECERWKCPCEWSGVLRPRKGGEFCSALTSVLRVGWTSALWWSLGQRSFHRTNHTFGGLPGALDCKDVRMRLVIYSLEQSVLNKFAPCWLLFP